MRNIDQLEFYEKWTQMENDNKELRKKLNFFEWQPIETFNLGEQIRCIGAYDKLSYVIGDIYFGQGAILLLKMSDKEYVKERMEKKWRFTHNDEPVINSPTHWMLLPPAPKVTNSQEVAKPIGD